ncbi:hypothetical protein M3P05_00465 [Sansalvadorimonas sp. 2012CJ34-2]|uniref:Uncharacterized protein n=1 Tax=Parendozoicomonas callyspongiae TaxID=2942213 RepID=A0ABT0PAK0_9GAMM|nr:hypothetical protein [Sansalvadorimonas sp. 2012CJ34-2]MCL6268422.1 hypothetical protein [Sansalvadorimonas sp. 2012CJ34-2]
MAWMQKGWLPSKIFSLMSSVNQERFRNRQIRAQSAKRIMMDSNGSPVVVIPMLDRFISSMTGATLMDTMVRRSGLDLDGLSKLTTSELSKLVKTLSGRRALQLLYMDATTNRSALLTSLLELQPDLLEHIISTLSSSERLWVFQMFERPAPELSAPAAEHAAQMMAHHIERKNIAPLFEHLLSHSKTEAGAAALSGLYHKRRLDFSLINDISHAFTPPAHLKDYCRDQGRDIVSSCHWHAQQVHDDKLTNHLQIYMDLMYQALPQYKSYWAACTDLPAEDCPVGDQFKSLEVSLARLTPQAVNALCQSREEDELVSIAARYGWKKIHSQSSATLRNPDAATGDFIYRVFNAELEPSWNRS